jgi:serine phosphatase RsbU (regulator of sigma subunit)/anti-sigma regulatory factor (Ser/Thr protein kinase)
MWTSATAGRDPATKSFVLACALDEVRPAVGQVCAFMEFHEFKVEEVRACELAMVEGANNAIKYAGHNLESIRIDALADAEAIEIRIHDHTPGFSWPKTIALPEPDQENGRGLFLISSLMDHVCYYRGEVSNCLVMLKKRTPHATKMVAREVESDDAHERRLSESEHVVRDMAEELSFCYESLSAIFRCSAELGRTNNLEDFARRLLSDLAQITSADWFVLRLVSPEESSLVVFSTSEEAHQLQPIALANSQSPPVSVEAEAALTREDVWFDLGNPLRSFDPLEQLKPASRGLVHPFFFSDSLIGTLTIAKTREGPPFSAVQANVVHTFTDFLAIQIVNARFTAEQLRTRLISRELEIAKTIQRALLPKIIPRLPGYRLAGFCESAHQVGGDFYDVIKIGDDSVLLVIADVMGKGIPAAMFAAILRSLLRAVPEWTSQPAALLGRVNRLMFEELSGVDMFITAQVVFINSKERTMTAASAGHCPLLLAVDGDGQVKAIAPEGLPLGILADTTFSNQTESLPNNCRVLLYTDGLTEARNVQGEFFGQERLMKWLRKTSQIKYSADELKESLAMELEEFQATTNLSDDQTFLIMTE